MGCWKTKRTFVLNNTKKEKSIILPFVNIIFKCDLIDTFTCAVYRQHGSRSLTEKKNKFYETIWWMKILWKTPHTVLLDPTAQRGQNRIKVYICTCTVSMVHTAYVSVCKLFQLLYVIRQMKKLQIDCKVSLKYVEVPRYVQNLKVTIYVANIF